MIPSITPSLNKLWADIFKLSAASSALEASLYNIAAHPSGEITEYTEFSSINILSETPSPSAPPLPPSPITTEITGTLSPLISIRFLAIASPCPCSSASNPGYAPGVSINVKIGIENLSAILKSLKAFL